MSDFKELILESPDTYDLLKEKLTPSPYSIIEKLDSLIDARATTDNPSDTLEAIKGLIKEFFERDRAQEALDSMKRGEDEYDVLGVLESAKDSGGSWCTSIDALGSDEERFEIEILQVGPLYYIRANEFDDIGWFASEKAAADYAKNEFASFIEALDEHSYLEENEGEDS